MKTLRPPRDDSKSHRDRKWKEAVGAAADIADLAGLRPPIADTDSHRDRKWKEQFARGVTDRKRTPPRDAVSSFRDRKWKEEVNRLIDP